MNKATLGPNEERLAAVSRTVSPRKFKPLLIKISKSPLKVQSSQGMDQLFQIECSKTVRTKIQDSGDLTEVKLARAGRDP